MSVFYSLKEKTKSFYQKHERYVTSGALLLGFVVDNLTLTRIDLWFDNLILFFYLTLAALGIILINLRDVGKLKGALVEKISPWFIIVMQYAFGGLFSGYFIFYSRSASLATSWMFILLLLGLVVGNELFKKKYLQFEFQVNLFFLSVFSFNIFFVPVILGKLGAWVFLLSGLVSLVVMGLFIFLLSRVTPKRIRESRNILLGSIGGIFFILNVFYFTNVIPPIPLSLKDADVYHLVKRTPSGDYTVRYEERRWYEFLKKYRNEFHRAPGESVYFYSAVFSPTDLDTTIYHSWQYFDEGKKEWIESFKKGYKIVGGRDEGYRGYTIKENIFSGRWRVDVMTERKQILGRYKFTVVDVQTLSVLEMGVR